MSNDPEAGAQPLLSVAIIARDEERHIARCVTSLCEITDDIVVVDTGSTDRTRQEAVRAGARVFTHTWRDSFSEARNRALALVRGSWVLHIDADEELDLLNSLRLQRELDRVPDDVMACLVTVVSPAASATSGVDIHHVYPRLFRNHRGIRFRGSDFGSIRRLSLLLNGLANVL